MPWGLAAAAVGVIGDAVVSGSKSSADNKAAGESLTGYNYLAGNAANQQAQGQGTAAADASVDTQNSEAQLLGTEPITNATKNGFNNYLNSTGYNFQLDQGTRAITGSAASRGILNSGSTAKALMSYGQNLAGQSFNNYLGNLSGLNTQQSNTANTGINAAQQVAQAGTTGGGNASQATQAAGNATGTGIGQAAGVVANTLNDPKTQNYFGSI